MQEGIYTGFDYYGVGNLLTLEQWQQFPQQSLPSEPTGAGGGFLVPEQLSRFYMTGTFGPNLLTAPP